MSNIGLNCDVCGRTIGGITYVNGMKFCAKCYQETFGRKMENANEITDMIITKMYQLEQENKQLKEQLAIREKALELACGEINEWSMNLSHDKMEDYFIKQAKENMKND